MLYDQWEQFRQFAVYLQNVECEVPDDNATVVEEEAEEGDEQPESEPEPPKKTKKKKKRKQAETDKERRRGHGGEVRFKVRVYSR